MICDDDDEPSLSLIEFLRLVSDRESVPGTANTSNCTDTTSDDVGSSASSNGQRSAVYKVAGWVGLLVYL